MTEHGIDADPHVVLTVQAAEGSANVHAYGFFLPCARAYWTCVSDENSEVSKVHVTAKVRWNCIIFLTSE